MENITVEDIKNVMEDPEQGCIVQADDPNMLAAAFDGANESSAQSGNTSWYWTSMLKLMEQGAAPSSSSTHNNNTNNACSGSHFTPVQHAPGPTPMPAAASSPSSSSVHDQPLDNMLVNNNAINTNDPDSSVWSQDFLSGPICESKPSNIHHLACSDDGLHELLYPRTVLELLFSDQLKLEQMPSWPDILQQTAGGTLGKSFGFPLAADKIAMTAPAATHNMNSDNQLDIKIPHYLNNYSHLTGLDDRLSSSTASSTLSDNTIDQWVPPNASTQCENAQAPRGGLITMQVSPLNSMQQIDFTLVKQEYPHAPSPTYTSNDINTHYSTKLNSPYLHQNQQRLIANPAGNIMDETILNNEFEQKPALINNKHWINSSIIPNDPLNHRHHIYESITAANFSNNVRLGGVDAASCFQQHVNNHVGGMGVGTIDHQSRVGGGGAGAAPASLHYMNQPSQQIGKKSRPLEGTGTGQVDETKKENNNIRAGAELDAKAKGAVHIIPGPTASSSPKQQQLSGTEYNFKRSRTEQNPPPPTSSSSSFKNQPVRKEKLGERITTLQQLVSPFGKTDTASVLLEAIGYIKFLQEQVQALSSPYFKTPTTQSGEEAKPDLRSRGLCLVPLSCTMQVANDNGADYWYGGAFR